MVNYQISGTTPNRQTWAEFDLTEQVVVCEAWGGSRTAAQIQGAIAKTQGKDGQYARNVRFWPGSNTWTLQPVQEKMSQFHEKLPTGLLPEDIFFLIGASEEAADSPGFSLTRLISLIEAGKLANAGTFYTRHLPGTLGFEPGESALEGMLDRGDWLYRRRVASGKSWAPADPVTVTPPPQNLFASAGIFATPGLPGANVIMDPFVQSARTLRADQGFFLRWCVPGTQNQFPDYIFNFHFGQFMVTICGDGTAKLLEYCRATEAGTYRWQLRRTWQYCRQGQAVGNTHTLLIYPQVGPFGDKFIHFANNMLDTAGVYGPSATTAEFSWLSDTITRDGDFDEAGPGHVTKEAVIRLDHRRDIKLGWQISKLMFVTEGTVTDAPFRRRLATNTTGSLPFQIQVKKRIPLQPAGSIGSNLNVTARFYDAVSRELYSTGSQGRIVYPLGVFTLTAATDPTTHGAADDTPMFDGYSVYQGPQTKVIEPGAFSAFDIAGYTATGSDFSLQSETGSLSVYDLQYVLPRLQSRGELSCRVRTLFTPRGSGTPVTVTLFRGYAQRPLNTQIKSDRENGKIALPLSGMWRRLAPDESTLRRSAIWKRYSYDPAAPNITYPGFLTPTYQPWKVTAVIADLLKQVGFPDEMIHIQDLPIRLWSGMKDLDDQEIDFYTDILSRVQRLALTYLGAALIFDANDGAEGAWRLVIDPGKLGQTPVFHFRLTPQYGGLPPHMPGAYDEGTGFVEGPLTRYVIPPGNNRVIVCTAPSAVQNGQLVQSGAVVSSEMYNYESYDVPLPGFPAADPDSPQYVGRERLLWHPDFALMGSGPNAYRDGQLACQLTCRRLFQYACLAREVRTVKGPLYFIQDAEHGNWRPMHFGDPVTFAGETDWFVRSCNPSINGGEGGDSTQSALYELQRTIPLGGIA